MIAGILLFLTLVSANVFFIVYYNEPFERTLPISLLGITFLMYIAGLMNALRDGIYVIFLLGVILYAAVIYKIVKQGIRKSVSQIVTVPFIMFTVFFFTILVANRGIRPHVWDEFTHWALAVKSMCYHDALPTRSHDVFVSKDYPPGVTLFQYFYARWVMLSRGTDVFPVGAAYAATQMLQISFVFPLIRHKNIDSALSIIMTSMLVFLFPLFFFESIYRDIYADSTMGILIGASIATVALTPVKEKNLYYHILVLLECAFLVLTKRVGILLSLCLGGAYLLDCLFTVKDNFKDKMWEFIIRIFCTVVAVLVPYEVFRFDLKKAIKLETISTTAETAAVDPPEPVLAFGSSKDFFAKFFTYKYNIGYTGLTISCFFVIVICFIAVYALYRMYGIYFKQEQKRIALQGWYCAFIIIAWTAVFYYLMLTTIEESVLDSFHRYIPPSFMPVAFISVFGFYHLISVSTDHKKKAVLSLVAILVVAIIIPVKEPLKLINGTYRENALNYYNPLKTLCEKQDELDMTEEDKIYFIAQGDIGFFYSEMRYYSYPTPFQSGPFWFSDGKPDEKNPDKIRYSTTIDADEFLDIVKKNNVKYVMIFRTDEYFNNHFSSIFESGTIIADSSIYTLSSTSGLLIEAK